MGQGDLADASNVGLRKEPRYLHNPLSADPWDFSMWAMAQFSSQALYSAA